MSQDKDSKTIHQLSLLEKYCTPDVCFQNEKPDHQMKAFFNENKSLIASEKQHESPNEDTPVIAASNILLMANNASYSKGNNEIMLSKAEYDSKAILKSIDRKWKITQKHKKAVEKEKSLSRTRFLTIVLISIGIISLVCLVYYGIKTSNLKAAANEPLQLNLIENFQAMFGSIPDRVAQRDALKKEASIAASYMSLSIISSIFFFALAVFNIIGRKISRKRIDFAKNLILDYHDLTDLFRRAEKIRREESILWDLK